MLALAHKNVSVTEISGNRPEVAIQLTTFIWTNSKDIQGAKQEEIGRFRAESLTTSSDLASETLRQHLELFIITQGLKMSQKQRRLPSPMKLPDHLSLRTNQFWPKTERKSIVVGREYTKTNPHVTIITYECLASQYRLDYLSIKQAISFPHD